MNTRWSMFLAVAFAAVSGCSRLQPPVDAANETPLVVQLEKLEDRVMTAKPSNAISVREALTRNDGERVVVSGRVPAENVKPYASAVASASRRPLPRQRPRPPERLCRMPRPT